MPVAFGVAGALDCLGKFIEHGRCGDGAGAVALLLVSGFVIGYGVSEAAR